MNKWIRRSLLGGATLGLLAAGTLVTGMQLADQKMNRHIALQVPDVPYRVDAAGILRGQYLYSSRGCVDCHGANGAGRVFIDDGGLFVKGPNISPGPGSVTADYTPQDWVRTIRHGVKRDQRPLIVMPSEDYNRLTDTDLAALVAYVRSLPPSPGGPAEVKLPPPVRAMYGFGLIPDAASRIDHALPPQLPVPEAVTPEHGRYVANMCIGCHGEHLSGGKIPGGPPDWPAAANLTPSDGSAMARYPDVQTFTAMLRSGKRPDGSPIKVMPFESLAHLSETDAQALYVHLKQVPAHPAGTR